MYSLLIAGHHYRQNDDGTTPSHHDQHDGLEQTNDSGGDFFRVRSWFCCGAAQRSIGSPLDSPLAIVHHHWGK